jgi:hypothetical protein
MVKATVLFCAVSLASITVLLQVVFINECTNHFGNKVSAEIELISLKTN